MPRGGVDFPLALRPPPGFRPDDPATWPRADGRLEYRDGRLWLLPPCGDEQQDVAASLVGILEPWSATHPDFVVGANEAGMILGGEARGADAAVWRRADASPRTGGWRPSAPVLAVEVAGRDEDEEHLREKATWYLDHGVALVWLVLPATREVVLIDADGERRFAGSDTLTSTLLPDLALSLPRLFRQL